MYASKACVQFFCILSTTYYHNLFFLIRDILGDSKLIFHFGFELPYTIGFYVVIFLAFM